MLTVGDDDGGERKLIFLRQANCCSMYGNSVGLGYGTIISPGSGLGWVSYLVG